MGVIIRQSIQNSIISYGGIALGFVTTILMFPRILTPDQYGLTRLLVSIALIAAQVSNLGMKSIIIRYFPYFKQMKGSKYNLLFLSFVVPLAGFLGFTVLFFLFKSEMIYYFQDVRDQSDLFSQYYLYLLPLVLFVLFFEVLNNYLRALQDSVTGSFLNEVVVRIMLIVLLGIYFLELISFSQFMIFFVLTYGIQPAYLIFYLYRHGELSFSIPFRTGKRRFARMLSVYGFYSLLGGLSSLLIGNIDIMMLSAMTDLGNTAVYFVAFSVGSVIAVPQRAIVKIAFPILADFIKNRQFDRVESLYKRTSLNLIIAGSLVLVGVWANMHNLMDLLPDEYHGGEWVIIIIGFAKLFNMATGINGGIISNSKHYRFDFYSKILLVGLTILTNYLMIPPYGIIGAALATAISIFVYNFIKFIYVWVTFGMQPFRWNAVFVLFIAVGCLLLSFQVPQIINLWVDVILRSITITTIFTGFVLFFNLSPDVKNLLQEILRRVQKLQS